MTKLLKADFTQTFNNFAVFAVVIDDSEEDSNLCETISDIVLIRARETVYSFITWPANARFRLRVASWIEGELDPTEDVTDTSSVLLLTLRLLRR